MAIAVVALAFLAVSGALYAQQLTGNIYGNITDEQGGRLPGVTVTLTGGGAPQTFTTDTRGEFRFLNLAPGDRYTVSYELPGFVRTTRTSVAVSIGRNTQADVVLKLAKVEAAVTVRAEAPLLETRKVATGAVVDQNQLREIPTARDPWVVLQTVPGVMVDRLNIGGNYSGQQSLFYAKGALGNQSTFNLDGVNITDMAALGSSGTYYDFDSFEEIQATTGGSDITAFTPGVQLNLVTKRGTNDVHGSARDLLTRQKWQSKNASSEFLAQPAGTNIPPRTDTIQDYGVEVGGPIWRDHLWAWGSYGRNQIDLITSTGATDKTTLEDANLKLNLQATESTAVTFGYTQGDKSKLGRNVGLTRPTSNEGWNQSGINGNPSALDKVEVSQVISSNLFLTASYAYFRGGFQLLPGSGDAINNLYRDDTNGGIYHNGYYTYRTQRPLHNAGTNGSFFFNTGQVGNELKFGFSYRKGGVVSTTTWPGNGNYGILGAFGVGKDAAELTRAASLKGTLQYWNAYLGDTISVGNLTVNAGLRYDVQSGYNQAGSSGANPIIPEVLPAIAGSDSPEPFKWKNWSPRVGATYALGDARKVVLKASYARFADQLGIGTLFNVNATQLAGVRYYWTDANGDKVVQRSELDFTKPAKCAGCPSGVQSAYGFDPKNPASPSSPNIIDPNLKAGKTDEVVAGVDYEVLPEFVVGASYTYRKYTDPIFTYRNGLTASSFVLCTTAVRSVCPTNGFINGTTKNGTGFSVPIYTLNPSTLLPASVLTTNRPDFDTTYNGIELTMQKRLSNKWMVRGNFGFQNWKQHAGSGSCAQLDPTNLLNGTFGAGCPGDDIMVGPSGTGSGATGNIFVNSKWNFNIAGLYQLPLGFNVGANFFGRQGYPYVQWVSINTGDGYGTKNVVVPPLDQQRNPNIFDADIRLEKVIELRPLSISLSLDVFNVANSATVLQRQGKIATCSNTSSQPSCSALVPNGSYNLITDFQSPRVVRAGARISF